MQHKQRDLLKATRKELRRQVFIGIFLIGFNWGMVGVSVSEWLYGVAILIALGLPVIYLARRGIWLMIWRGFVLYD